MSERRVLKKRVIRHICIFLAVFMGFPVFVPKSAFAALCTCGVGGTGQPVKPDTCNTSDCAAAAVYVTNAHRRLTNATNSEFQADLNAFEDWLIEDLFYGQIGPAMASMSTQMHAVSMFYTQAVGSFLDAQVQMDTQRLFRQLQHQAHVDYRPSEDFCWFGSNVKSLAASQNKAKFNALALSQISLTRQLGTFASSSAGTTLDDYKARWSEFTTTYCNPRDNNFQQELLTGNAENTTGLVMACDHDGPGGGDDSGAEDRNRYNIDISYTRLIEDPKTLEIDFSDNTLEVEAEPQATLYRALSRQPEHERDVIALSRNLYGHRVPTRAISRAALRTDPARKLFMALRGVIAKRSVAQASFNAIVGLKASGTSHELGGTSAGPGGIGTIALAPLQTRRFLAAIVRELLPESDITTGGIIPGNNIFGYIGFSPSYYSQLEILAKRIYQNPDFYANLYDTPANISRKKVAMKAIELMVDREIYESQLRREMSVSVLLSSKLRSLHRAANRGVKATEGRQK